jgi:hypothetical protein
LVLQQRLHDRPKWAERALTWHRAALLSCGAIPTDVDDVGGASSPPRAEFDFCVASLIAMGAVHKVVGQRKPRIPGWVEADLAESVALLAGDRAANLARMKALLSEAEALDRTLIGGGRSLWLKRYTDVFSRYALSPGPFASSIRVTENADVCRPLAQTTCSKRAAPFASSPTVHDPSRPPCRSKGTTSSLSKPNPLHTLP